MRDQEIIELYFQRSETAITETSAKYGAYCHTVAMNILRDIFDAEECVNDTYHRAWRSIPPTRPTRLGAFLAKITRNLAIDRYNRKKAKKRGGEYAESLEELGDCIGVNDSTGETLEELGAIISEFLKSEKELARRLFVRRYFYENSIKQISEIHGISESLVKTTLHRTRARLAIYLRKEGVYL